MKKQQQVNKLKYDVQLIILGMIVKLHKIYLLSKGFFIIIKILMKNEYSSLKKIWIDLLKDIRLDKFRKNTDSYKAVTMKKSIYLLYI